MMDYIAQFIYNIYSSIWYAFESVIPTGLDYPGITEPIVFVAFCAAYIFCVVFVVKLIVGSIRWFYRI